MSQNYLNSGVVYKNSIRKLEECIKLSPNLKDDLRDKRMESSRFVSFVMAKNISANHSDQTSGSSGKKLLFKNTILSEKTDTHVGKYISSQNQHVTPKNKFNGNLLCTRLPSPSEVCIDPLQNHDKEQYLTYITRKRKTLEGLLNDELFLMSKIASVSKEREGYVSGVLKRQEELLTDEAIVAEQTAPIVELKALIALWETKLQNANEMHNEKLDNLKRFMVHGVANVKILEQRLLSEITNITAEHRLLRSSTGSS